MDAGGHWDETISMDYPKIGGFGHGLGIPLLYGHPRMSLPTVGKRLVNQDGSSNSLLPGETKILDQAGRLTQVLTIQLEDEYWQHQKQTLPQTDIQEWLDEFPEAWAETGGTGLARHRPPIYIDLKSGADPV